jgi:uncharacterized membrane-anchored protein
VHTYSQGAIVAHPESFSGASVDKRRGRAEDRRMGDRLTALEENVASLKGDVALIRSNYATKEDIAKLAEQIARSKADMLEMINTQTWKYITWTTSAMALMTTTVYFIARNVH